MRRIRKRNLLAQCASIVLASLFVAPLARADWMWYCDKYANEISNECGSPADGCGGVCKKYGNPVEGADCGFCAETFDPFSWCTNTYPPTYVTYAALRSSCSLAYEYQGDVIEYWCECGDFAFVGTVNNGCYCW